MAGHLHRPAGDAGQRRNLTFMNNNCRYVATVTVGNKRPSISAGRPASNFSDREKAADETVVKRHSLQRCEQRRDAGTLKQ
jgi:hypothetical protein